MKFSVGYNQNIKFLDVMDEYRRHIEAVYFPVPYAYMGSGRSVVQRTGYGKEIPRIIRTCSSLHIRSQLLLNATCEGPHFGERAVVRRLIDYVKHLAHIGLTNVVVANPVYIGILRKEIPGLEIESSINCFVRTVEHALYLKDLGVDIITIDRDINRNIPLIRDIKQATGLRLRILVNEACLRNCPFRYVHFNQISHQADAAIQRGRRTFDPVFQNRWCAALYARDPSHIFRTSFIPPDKLRYYQGVVDYFKISTRDSPLESLRYKLDAYSKESYSGNLLKLFDCTGVRVLYEYLDYATLQKNRFFERMLQCRDRCRQCGFCSRLAERSIVTKSKYLPEEHPVRIEERSKAIAKLTGFLRAGCTDTAVSLLLSGYYEAAGRYRDAIRILQNELKRCPRDTSVNFELARCSKALGKMADYQQQTDRGFRGIDISEYRRIQI